MELYAKSAQAKNEEVKKQVSELIRNLSTDGKIKEAIFHKWNEEVLQGETNELKKWEKKESFFDQLPENPNLEDDEPSRQPNAKKVKITNRNLNKKQTLNKPHGSDNQSEKKAPTVQKSMDQKGKKTLNQLQPKPPLQPQPRRSQRLNTYANTVQKSLPSDNPRRIVPQIPPQRGQHQAPGRSNFRNRRPPPGKK